MRLGILAAVLAVAVGLAYWTTDQHRRQTQWLSAYKEAGDSFERRHYADAEGQLRMIMPEAKWPTEHRAALAMNLLGLVYHEEGRGQEVVPLFETAIQIFAKEGQSSQMDLAKSCNNVGRIYLEQRRLPEAEQKLQQAIAIFQKEPTVAKAELGSALQNLGLVRVGQKRDKDAQALLEQAVQIYQQYLPPDHLDLAQGYLDLAGEYRNEGLLINARDMDQKALAIQERAFGSESPVVKQTRARVDLESKAASAAGLDQPEKSKP